MFQPKYTITNLLLANIKRISSLVTQLNNLRFSHVVLAELEKTARAVSSHASTSIEGNPLPLTEVKKILKSTPAHVRDSEKEVLNYNTALLHLNEKLASPPTPLSLDLILDIHKLVMQDLLPDFEVGRLRQKPVIVNDPRTGRTIYMPPDASEVKTLTPQLVEFVAANHQTIDPLILAGIFHKQLVLIHPFMDGNGRTTRLATKVLLAQMGLNTFKLFSFENYYNQNVTRYFQMVGELGNYYEIVSHIDFTSWLEYFTEGIIDELLRIQKNLPMAQNPSERLRSHDQQILTFIQENGFITDRDYAKLTRRAKATRALDFKKLISLGLIERRAKAKSTYYVLKDL
ncbi:MAG: Uncharacterized protein G01um101416_1237 [Microgenomates group bacterium Gr01-1014_16]|nr:MAG: Uncharacterized protein G01um101416_1237 [Microgenomates group bacterium Gr01-1014_16]